jgi:hypothetical protein
MRKPRPARVPKSLEPLVGTSSVENHLPLPGNEAPVGRRVIIQPTHWPKHPFYEPRDFAGCFHDRRHEQDWRANVQHQDRGDCKHCGSPCMPSLLDLVLSALIHLLSANARAQLPGGPGRHRLGLPGQLQRVVRHLLHVASQVKKQA